MSVKKLSDVIAEMGLLASDPTEMEKILDYASVVLYVNKAARVVGENGIVSIDVTRDYDPIGLMQSIDRTYQRNVGEVGEIGSEGGVIVVNEQTKTMSLSRLLHRAGSLLAQLYQSIGAVDITMVYNDVTKPIFRKNKFDMILEIYEWNDTGTGKDLMGKILYQGCKANSLGTSINWRENISMEGCTIVWDKTKELTVESD